MKRIYRSRQDRMIGGVCGGLGEYFRISSTFIRAAFLIALLVVGQGVLLYLILWWIIPEEPSEIVVEAYKVKNDEVV